MKGVCCSCQSVHPVRQYTPTREDKEQWDETDGGEEINWVMDYHRMFGDTGPVCTGEGTTPQFLVKENK